MLVNTFADLQLIGSNNNTLGGTYALGRTSMPTTWRRSEAPGRRSPACSTAKATPSAMP